MAKLIECDRCGATQRLLPPGPKDAPQIPTGPIAKELELPSGWIRFPTLGVNVPNPLGRGGSIEGGEFCVFCAKALAEWRRPIPRCAEPAPDPTKPY